MTEPLVALDHALIPLMVVVSLVEWLWTWPRSVRAIAAGVPGARMRVYRNILVLEWTFAAGVLGLWVVRGRPWSALHLGASTPLRLGLGCALAVLYLGLAWSMRRAILARPERLERLLRRAAYADPLLPRTSAERWGIAWTSITAGLCEELFYRGFVTWYAGLWTGPVLAVALSSLLFGFGHIYLGTPQVLRTTVVGVVFSLLVLAAGSLWPAILVHAAMDLVSSDLGYRALRRRELASADPLVPAGA